MASLANRYRSQTFDDLIGQDHISTILKYQAKEHIRQANYLFFGPRGTGKTSSARLLAKAVNCLNIEKTEGNPCNECENCLAINAGTTVDIMEIDAASHTGVDNMRDEIIAKMAYRPQQLKKRVIIIDEVHMLSKGAFNALLKTMEEPTEWVVFILATTEFNKVPDTIISRCQLFNFKKIPSLQIVDHLTEIAKKEHITATEEGLRMIADLSDGCMRDAIKYLDQISVMGAVEESSVAQFLGVVSETTLSEFVELFKIYQESPREENFNTFIHFLQNIHKQGVDLTVFPKQLIHYADRYFVDDPVSFSAISVFASELLRQARRFPHPLLLYKTLIFQLGDRENTMYNQGQETTEKGKNTKVSGKKGGATTKDQLEKETKKPSTTTNIGTKSKASAPSGDSKAPDKTLDAGEKNNGGDSLESLRNKTLSSLSSSLQKVFSEQSELISIEDGVAHIIVTNSLAKLSLKQKKSKEILLSTLSKISGQEISHIDSKHMTKEEYFQHQMKD